MYLLSNQENEGEFFRKEFVITNRQANENFIKPNEMRNLPSGQRESLDDKMQYLRKFKKTVQNSRVN